MKRLRDIPAHSPLLAHAQRLIRSAPQIPDSPERMLRIQRAIEDSPQRGAAVLVRAPAFALAGVLLLFGASAFAAVRVWVEHRAAAVRAPEAGPAEAPAATHAREPRAGASSLVDPAPQLEAANGSAALDRPAAATTAQSSTVSAPVHRVRRLEDGHKARRSSRRHKLTRAARGAKSRPAPAVVASAAADAAFESSTSPALVAAEVSQAAPSSLERSEEREAIPEPAQLTRAAKRSSDSELVVRAVETLRRDHDPALAARLLEQYRTRNPAGVLAEEVLSLQIEAAGAVGDPRARSYAREYLSRYPDGRYRERAERALGGAAP